MRVALFVCCLFLVGPWAGEARAADDNYSVLGLGNDTCGTWTQGRSVHEAATAPGARVDQTEWATQFARQQWVAGFIGSATVLIWTEYGVDIMSGLDAQAVWAWIDNYCAENPLDSVNIAAIELGKELHTRAENR